MHPATIITATDDTSLDEHGLVQALIDQRRTRLGHESGIDDEITTLRAFGDVLVELLDVEPADRWRSRAAADLHRLGISTALQGPLVAVA